MYKTIKIPEMAFKNAEELKSIERAHTDRAWYIRRQETLDRRYGHGFWASISKILDNLFSWETEGRGNFNDAMMVLGAGARGNPVRIGVYPIELVPARGRNTQPSRTWKPGEDIYAPTGRGLVPSDRTIGRRFWQSEAENPSRRDYTPQDLARMRRGEPPRRLNTDTGKMESMERSHEPVPRREGGESMVPRWPEEHSEVDPHRHTGH